VIRLRRQHLRRSTRGFTLAELLVYLALVSTALVVFGMIEMGARRSVALQGALIDCESSAQRYLSPLRRDVEDARSVAAVTTCLNIVRLDGTRVTYTAKERVERSAEGKVVVRQPFALAQKVEFSASKNEVRAKLTLRCVFGWRDAIERTYERVSTPRVGS
jgi:type II secretory pathway pseudopilin PulG